MENFKEYSNAELNRKKLSIENEFETIKNQISSLCDKLDNLDKEYTLLTKEIDNRRKI